MRVTKRDIKAASHGAVWCEYNGTLYGDYNGNVVKSTDGWLSVERVVDLGARIGCIYVTSNGTLIVGTRETFGRFFRITPDGKTELVLAHEKRNLYSRSWSINGHGSKVVIGAYGQKLAPNPEDNAREVYYSDDDGITFNKIYEVPALGTVHIHATAIDAVTNNVWVSNGDGPSYIRLLEYPNWTPIVIKEGYQPTAIIAKHERYVLFGSDYGLPQNGVVRYDRDTEELIQVFTFPTGFDNAAYSAFYDTETKTAYFGTAQVARYASMICKSQPPFTDWEVIIEDEPEKYSVVKAITKSREVLYFARDEGTLTIPKIDTRKYYIKEPYRKP